MYGGLLRKCVLLFRVGYQVRGHLVAFVPTGLLGVLLWQSAVAADEGARYFKIVVVDDQTGRGVPMVELRTTNEVRYWTDSNGVVAFYEPGLMNRKVFFHVHSDGYEFPEDRFGYRGRALRVVPGGEARLRIRRLNIAERLYRVTGAGIYRDSVLTGHPVPISRPLLNGLVFGSDSVQTTVYHGRVYWFWGDTNRPSYPLGNFHVPGATSLLPGAGGLDPEVGVDLEYFVNEEGFAKEMARMPGRGPTWLSGLVTLIDSSGKERMLAGYVKVAPPMRVYERGLMEFDDRHQMFRKRTEFPPDAALWPAGHAFLHQDAGVRYVYFAHWVPPIRVPATVEAMEDPRRYEAFSCFKPGGREDHFELDRAGDGQLQYGWKPDTTALSPKLQRQLVKQGRLKPGELIAPLQDVDTGRPIQPHSNSVYWNQFRQRWVMILLEQFGSPSFLGEVWYAEGDTPIGPWVYARKVVTHEKYSFYNPKHHPMFDKDGGRVIFFEGTYSTFLSGVQVPTPRYNYNQIMYKLDLADPRLVLPVPVYRWRDRDGRVRWATRPNLPADRPADDIPFFALDRPKAGAVPVFYRQTADGTGKLEAAAPLETKDPPDRAPVFYGLPAEMKDPPATTQVLYQTTGPDGRLRYGLSAENATEHRHARARPICRVWKNPIGVPIHWR